MTKYSTLAIACGLSDVAGWLENEGWIPKHVRQIRAGAQRLLELEARARPLSEWTEGDGDVLWWRFPIEEPPYCGSPLDLGQTVEVAFRQHGETEKVRRFQVGGWPGYHTHWTRFDVPDQGRALAGEAGTAETQSGSVHEHAADLSATPETLLARATAAEAERDRLGARLEIDHAWDGAGNRIPFPVGMEHLDGIACRDETIRNLEGVIAAAEATLREKEAEIERLTSEAHMLREVQEAVVSRWREAAMIATMGDLKRLQRLLSASQSHIAGSALTQPAAPASSDEATNG